MLNEEGENKNPKNITDSIKKQIEICQILVDDDYMYIPFSACLISRFPFIDQMEKCLDNFINLYFDQKLENEEIYKYISYLVNSIYIPPPEKMLYFYIPYSKNLIEIYNNNIGDLALTTFSMWKILENLSLENIVFIFNLIILEQKILFVANEYKVLSETIEGFINLIYPLQ